MNGSTTTELDELRHVDPENLIIGPNVRRDGEYLGLLESISQRGVLAPIVAAETPDGLTVVMGQRRTMAAREAGLPLVPVVVMTAPDEVNRLIDQVTENVHRAALGAGDLVAAYEQLAVLGLDADAIARRAARPRPEVGKALAVAASAAARAATAKYAFLDLEQAATLAEFDDDRETVKALVAAAQTGQFDHTAQRARDRRQATEALTAATAGLAEQGVTLVDRPDYNAKAKTLTGLVDAKGKDVKAAGHHKCEGHAAYLDSDYVRRAAVDGHDTVYKPVFVCTDPGKYGHRPRYGPTPAAAKSEEQRQAESAERRRVIANNKAWVAAEPVRRRWLADFLTRKTAPAGAAAFVGVAIVAADFAVTNAMQTYHPLVHEMLGLEKPTYSERGVLPGMLDKASPARALHLTLAVLLCAYEGATTKDCWRGPGEGLKRYLRFLACEGYTLSEVERLAAGLADEDASGNEERP